MPGADKVGLCTEDRVPAPDNTLRSVNIKHTYDNGAGTTFTTDHFHVAEELALLGLYNPITKVYNIAACKIHERDVCFPPRKVAWLASLPVPSTKVETNLNTPVP